MPLEHWQARCRTCGVEVPVDHDPDRETGTKWLEPCPNCGQLSFADLTRPAATPEEPKLESDGRRKRKGGD